MRLLLGIVHEWRISSDQLKGEDADRPDVHAFSVLFPPHELWRQIIECAAERSPPIAGTVGRPTKVGDLDDAAAVEQVFWLDVAMDDVFSVHVLKRIDRLSDVVGGSLFLEPLIGRVSQLCEDFATMSVFKDKVDLLLVPEVAEETANVVVLQVSLNLDLAAKLL